MKKNIFYIMWNFFYSKGFVLFIILIGTFLLPTAFSMLNPSTVYCTALGYDYKNVQIPEGEVGMCVFPDNTNVNAWDFLTGKVALERSYCAKEGYEAKHVVNMEICYNSDECTVCVLKNGTEIEVTKLMGLNFQEGLCGDSVCTIGENYLNCPQDCPTGSMDMYCDSFADGVCDPDCKTQDKDPDCPTPTTTITATTEITTTTIQLCNKNKKCEPVLGENFKNCPKDCLSGSEDGYCDGKADGICDPDCNKDDIDCMKSGSNLLIFGIVIGIVIVLVLVIVIKSRRFK